MKNRLNDRQKIAIYINVIIRTVFPLWVFVNPVQGALIALLVDCIDYQPLVNYFKIPRIVYELQDKYLDFYWYVLICLYIIVFPVPDFVRSIIIVAFGIRFSGTIVFSLIKKEAVLVFFPNIIEPLFWVWLIFPKVYESVGVFVVMFIILVIAKLVHEYIVHIKKFSPIDYVLDIVRNN